jgi:hypothetical protein
MQNPFAIKESTRQSAETTGRSARQTDKGLLGAPTLIVPQTGLCIYVSGQRYNGPVGFNVEVS